MKQTTQTLITTILIVLGSFGGVWVYVESKFASVERVEGLERKIDVILTWVLEQKK